MRRLALALILAALAPAAPAHAEGRDREQRAVALINRAIHRVLARDAGCRIGGPTGRPAFTDGDPSTTLQSALGILRRPPTDAELAYLDAKRHIFAPGVQTMSRRGTRIVHSASGVEFTITTGTTLDSLRDRATYDRCQARIRTELLRLAIRARRDVRREALRTFDQVTRAERPPAESKVVDALFMDVRVAGGTGGTGGAFDPERFTTRGIWLSSQRREPISHHALGPRMEWRDAAGNVVRVVPGRG